MAAAAAETANAPEPSSPVRPASAPVGDLQVFLLESPPVALAACSALPPENAPSSLGRAWASFVGGPASSAGQIRRLAIPSVGTSDAKVQLLFRHPPEAVPPPRLAAFALPASISPSAFDQPSDVNFCLTLANGHRVHGAALQLAEQLDDDTTDASAPHNRVVLRSLVMLSRWPVHDLWRTMLHTIYSRGEAIGPTGALCQKAPTPDASAADVEMADVSDASPSASAAPSSPRPSSVDLLRDLLLHTTEVLGASQQELNWLTTHPLYLPTPLAPLFKALRWSASEAAYLLAALLTDQKGLLHSEQPHRLYCATCALRSLMTPLASSAVFIPLLPTHLMSLDEAHTLLHDCSTPYLIGVESAMLAAFDSALPQTAVVVDLDRGVVRRAPGSEEWFTARAPPFESLVHELQGCMGAGAAFKALRAQAACLRFVIDVVNVRSGFLARSAADADADALSRFNLLETFAEDASARCKQQARPGTPLNTPAIDCLRTALHQSVGARLSEVCAEAHVRHGGAAVGEASAGGGSSNGGRLRARSSSCSSISVASVGGSSSALGEWNALVSSAVAGQESGAVGFACCGALSHIYAAQPFREWWDARSPSRAPERLQWLDYRTKGVDLREYLRENHRSMKVLERSLEARLHAIWAAEPQPTTEQAPPPAADASPPAAASPPTAGAAKHRRSNSSPAGMQNAGKPVSSTRGQQLSAELD